MDDLANLALIFPLYDLTPLKSKLLSKLKRKVIMTLCFAIHTMGKLE